MGSSFCASFDEWNSYLTILRETFCVLKTCTTIRIEGKFSQKLKPPSLIYKQEYFVSRECSISNPTVYQTKKLRNSYTALHINSDLKNNSKDLWLNTLGASQSMKNRPLFIFLQTNRCSGRTRNFSKSWKFPCQGSFLFGRLVASCHLHSGLKYLSRQSMI